MRLPRILASLLALALSCIPQLAAAKVTLSFYSYKGSVILPGPYPHAYIRLEGALEESGAKVLEIYGFTPKSVSSAAMNGNTSGFIHEKKSRFLEGNRNKFHFSVTLSDAQYRKVMNEVNAWRSSTYNLGNRNCLHFVATVARLVGIDATVPDNLTRKPKAWLNYVGRRNPQLNAREVK